MSLPTSFDVAELDEGGGPGIDALRELAFRKAMADKVWFLENFWWVIDPNTMKWVKFRLRDYQRTDAQDFAQDMREERARRVIGKARQVGATTLLAASSIHDMLANPNHPWLVSSQSDEDAKETLGSRMKTPFLMLPEWFRDRAPRLKNDSVESMEFDNGSRVLSVPSTSRAGRGKVVFGVIMDEAAHAEKAEDVFAAMDPMCYGPLYKLSTGNGMGNDFHATWVDSDRYDTEWKQTFHPWFVVPGRDQKWYEREKRKYRGREHIFYQEYPANPEEMFAKTGLAVLPMDLLRSEQEWVEPALKIDLTMHWQHLQDAPAMEPHEESNDELWVWEPPTVERDERGWAMRSPNYVIFADPSEGLPHGDRSSITVVNANTLEEAASYRGYWPIEDMGELLNYLGHWYHQALILPERNNQGIVVVNDLSKIWHYPRIYRMGSLAKLPTGQRDKRYGWITTTGTKPKMVFDFIKALRDGHILLHDVRFLEEASTFIRTERGGFAASGSNYDDHVMSHLGVWQGVLEVGQYPIVWTDEGVTPPFTMGDLLELMDELDDPELDQLAAGIGQRPPEKGQGISFVIT